MTVVLSPALQKHISEHTQWGAFKKVEHILENHPQRMII